jgi:D-3-phosphoglycerate dehydrogenase
VSGRRGSLGAVKKALYFSMLRYHEDNLDLLKRHFRVEERPTPEGLDGAELADVNLLFAPLGYYFGEEIMRQAPVLEAIATNTTGTPHIDMADAAVRGIKVISLAGEEQFLRTITPTAELTIGLIIAVTRNLIPAMDYVKKGAWGRWGFGGPAMLSRMSLGIVGLGRLGKMVAAYAHAMGMRVSYYDPYVDHRPEWPYRRAGTLNELVGGVDVTTVHCNVTPENRHMFNREVFSGFRKSSFFVNTARGELVDSEALIEALDGGILRGAAVDVVDGEFSPAFDREAGNHPLIRYARENPSLLITPHIGGSTYDAWFETQRFTIENAIAAVYQPSESGTA